LPAELVAAGRGYRMTFQGWKNIDDSFYGHDPETGLIEDEWYSVDIRTPE